MHDLIGCFIVSITSHLSSVTSISFKIPLDICSLISVLSIYKLFVYLYSVGFQSKSCRSGHTCTSSNSAFVSHIIRSNFALFVLL